MYYCPEYQDVWAKPLYVSPQVEAIEKRCLDLFARDYKFSIIYNTNGEVCGHYPRQIVFLEYECTDVDRDRYHTTAQPVPSFCIQSPIHSVTDYPHVCFCHSCKSCVPNYGGRGKGQPPFPAPLITSEG